MLDLALFTLVCLNKPGPGSDVPEPAPVEGPGAPEEPGESDFAGTPDEVPVSESGDYVIVEAAPASAFEEPSPRALEFRAGVMTMVRPGVRLSRGVDGEASSLTDAPTRLRAQLEARAPGLRMLAQLQDVYVLGEDPRSDRSGFHQLYVEATHPLPRGTLVMRAGRQEFELGSLHLLGTRAWLPGMQSWDAVRVAFEGARGSLGVFAGSLARPLLADSASLVEQVTSTPTLQWLIDGHYAIADALTVEGLISGSHRRDSADTRNIVTYGLRLYGDIVPGLSYAAEGQLQTGSIEGPVRRQRHLAGQAYGVLSYLTPRGVGAGKRTKPGAFLSLDFASGTECTTTDYAGLAPCTEGTNHDFDAPWMRRHKWFGHADRFRAQNVIDGAVGVRVVTTPMDSLSLELGATNHVFALPEPGGRWHDVGGNLIGLELDNRDPWAADEVDVEAALGYKWMALKLGWLVVANLSGGRALSGEAINQLVYVMLVIDWWSPWR